MESSSIKQFSFIYGGEFQNGYVQMRSLRQGSERAWYVLRSTNETDALGRRAAEGLFQPLVLSGVLSHIY
jgi:hypothetical protein